MHSGDWNVSGEYDPLQADSPDQVRGWIKHRRSIAAMTAVGLVFPSASTASIFGGPALEHDQDEFESCA